MTYTHLTPNELVMIEAYFHQKLRLPSFRSSLNVDAKQFTMSITFLKCGGTALEYFEQYKRK